MDSTEHTLTHIALQMCMSKVSLIKRIRAKKIGKSSYDSSRVYCRIFVLKTKVKRKKNFKFVLKCFGFITVVKFLFVCFLLFLFLF